MKAPPRSSVPSISIIGAGKVGTAIGVLAQRAGLRVVAVAGRSDPRASAKAIGPDVRVCSPAEAAAAGRLVLLTVPDDAIASVCGELAGAGAFAAGAIVAHCSGALGSDVLAPAAGACGALTASCHPLQTFPTVAAAVERMPGTYWFCEGHPEALGALEELIRLIGGNPVRIGAGAKTTYHAGAVAACNYLAATVDAGLALCENAGLDRATALAALGPLVRATADNVVRLGPAAALTGPIARGDTTTVRRHLEALADLDEDLLGLYRAVGAWTVRLARSKGTIDAATAGALRRLLCDNGPKPRE